MSDSLSPSSVAERLYDLKRGFEERALLERAWEQLASDGSDAQRRELEEALERLTAQHEAQLADIQTAAQQELSTHEEQYESERAEAEAELNKVCSRIDREAHEATLAVKRRHEESSWVLSSVLDDSSEHSPRRQYERSVTLHEKSQTQQQAALAELQKSVAVLADERGWEPADVPPPSDLPRDLEQLLTRFYEAVEGARQALGDLQRLLLPRLFVGYRPLCLLIALTGVLGIPVWALVDPGVLKLGVSADDTAWLGIAIGAAAVISLLLLGVLYLVASLRVADVFSLVQEHRVTAEACHHAWLTQARREGVQREKEFRERQEQLQQERTQHLSRLQAAVEEQLSGIDAERTRNLQTARDQFAQQFAAHEQRHQAFRDQWAARSDQDRVRLTEKFQSECTRLQEQLDHHVAGRHRQQQQAWEQLTHTWSSHLVAIDEAETMATTESRRQFRDWSVLSAADWEPPVRVPNGIRVGEFAIETSRLDQSVPRQTSLASPRDEYRFPAMLVFPEATSVLFKTRGARGRREALQAMQVLLLRTLTLIPPGKLRLTIFDPIGLGESFSGFMHLADFDELLITSRIWTETPHIEAQLASLTEHMENVLQKYLRNEFASIEEYNRFAGEVAEPYHVLVVTDFPGKFSEQAAQRLVSVATSGPRCGVFLLMSADVDAPPPHGFDLDNIESSASTFTWNDGAYRFDHPVLERCPLVIDEPPPPETFTTIVKNVGEASKDVRRVEVSFSRVAPPPEQVWTGDARRGIDIPLGRAGAMKLQRLKLGQGTSQHVLVAGKTGSGKSTFLHALITSAALHYSPDEVNFALVDFKKGVEFKAYASHGLPHALVIGIESDREFGVSVLQRLDAMLHERGDLFRQQGVQDIGAFRDRNPSRRMPRILLIIDEFQEFFVEDDQLSQTAGLLLDRLVRQGRAFGIHVILGSQTLGGAYSLARSTLGQIAIRVALQCSEADAHLILSEENTAARLLTRPGEAIYNDANGRVEGNHPFQIAWLPDEEREAYLTVLREFAVERGLEPAPPVIFEGNVPSDPSRNRELLHLLTRRDVAPDDAPTPVSQVWLGEAVQIGPPTSVTFPQQAGSNLLIAGQDAGAATGILANALITLAGHDQDREPTTTADSARFWIFDGNPVGTAEAELWKRVANVVGPATRIITPPAAAQALSELTADCGQRAALPDHARRPSFLVITNLSKFRDLRKAEDDFGLGSFGSPQSEAPPAPGKLFADLLVKGPEVGIHTLLWVDTYANLERWLSRQSLKEIELRVLFQMNAGDSSNLIDNPAASRLGVHRALLYREETGEVTKFRPYGPPESTWLDWVQNHLRSSGSTMEPASDLDEFSVA